MLETREKIELERVLIEQLFVLQKETMKSVLLYAECSMTESQFRAYRKLVLDAFGNRGLERKINDAVAKVLERAGADARIREYGKEGGVMSG